MLSFLPKLWREIGRDTRWVMVSYALWGVGEGLWIFMQPLYIRSLGATPAQTGFVLGMWGLARLLFILPAGVLADRWGARRLMLPGWYIGLSGVLMIALAPDWRWAAPGYLVYGISSAAIPATNLYLAQSVRHDPTRHPGLPLQASLTLLWSAYSIGLVVSPTLGGITGDAIGLRAVFAISTLWFGLSTLAITRTHVYPVAERPAQGTDYRGLLRRWPVMMPFLVAGLGFVALYTGQTLSSQFLEEVRAFSRTSIGLFGSISALGTTLFSISLGRLSSWRGFFASLLLVLAALVLLLSSGAWPLVALAVFLLGAYNTARPLATSIISEHVPDHQRGMAYALLDTVAGLAAVIATNTAGRLYAVQPGWPFRAAIAGILGVVLLGTLLHRPRRNRETSPAYIRVEEIGK